MNDLQRFFDAMSAQDRRTRSQYHLTLGKLIEQLKEMPPEMTVMFSDGTSPGCFDSYRGYYDDLALDNQAEAMTAAEMLRKAEAALDETFQGYKGGDYRMGPDTPLWKAEYGCCGPALVAFERATDALILVTK